MKTTILSILTIGATLTALQLYFLEIPKIQNKYSNLEYEKIELEETVLKLESENKLLAAQLQGVSEKAKLLADSIKESQKEVVAPVIEVPVETPESEPDYSEHNASILAQINSLKDQKRVEETSLQAKLSEIDGYIAKGKSLLETHLNIKPPFKDGAIRTSDADRAIWNQKYKERETFLRTEISKLEGQKESLRRAFKAYEEKIYMDSQKLQLQIK